MLFCEIVTLKLNAPPSSKAWQFAEIRVKQDPSLFRFCDMEHTGINQTLDICNGFLVVFYFLVEYFNLVGLYMHSILEAERLWNILVDR